MTAPRKIVVWRHGQTAWNVERRFQGAVDIPLDSTGAEQAERAARLLAALRPTAIVSSDLCRAADTAAALGRLTGIPVTLDPDLRERGGGEWEGLANPEIRRRWPAEYAVWEPPGGESTEDLAKRFAAAMDRATQRLPAGGLLVAVSHGAAIRLGIATLLGLTGELSGRLGGLANCCWSVLQEGHIGWRLVEHNAGTLPEPVLSDDRTEADA